MRALTSLICLADQPVSLEGGAGGAKTYCSRVDVAKGYLPIHFACLVKRRKSPLFGSESLRSHLAASISKVMSLELAWQLASAKGFLLNPIAFPFDDVRFQEILNTVCHEHKIDGLILDNLQSARNWSVLGVSELVVYRLPNGENERLQVFGSGKEALSRVEPPRRIADFVRKFSL